MRSLVIALLIVIGLWVVAVIALIAAGRRFAVGALMGLVPNLMRLVRDLVRDPRVPRSSKVILVAAAAWIASPIDLIPEFVPALGPIDDVVVGILALRHVVRRAGAEVVRDHWRGDLATIGVILRAAGA